MQERKKTFSQNDAEDFTKDGLGAIAAERETKPHSTRKSNEEVVGHKIDSACLVVA